MMFSPPSSLSVLASTSRHDILQLHQWAKQKSLQLFLGHQSDEEAASDCDFDFHNDAQDDTDSDSDSDGSVLGRASGSRSRQSLQPGRISGTRPRFSAIGRPVRRAVSDRICDGASAPGGQARRPRLGASPKKASIFAAAATTKQQAAAAAAIPTTPTKRQKGFLIRGNVTPSRAFSIFKAAKQRSQQRQEHGLMTPPTSSSLRPIILDSFEDDFAGVVQESPSRRRARPSPASLSPLKRYHTLTSSSQERSAYTSSTSRFSSHHTFDPPSSAFGGGRNSHLSLPHVLQNLRIRRSLHSSQSSSTAYSHLIDTTSFLETFVSPSSCRTRIPRSCDDDILSHPISAAYSYSSRSVNPSAQWLAVGDDEGRITLLDTLPWQDETAKAPSANPQWQASSSSAIFEVVWRFDDRSILSGSSDFRVRSWDTEYQKCTGSFEGHNGSPRTIVFDPTTNGDGGCGMVFASAGRDGSVRIWDARVGASGQSEDGYGVMRPMLTINAAHSSIAPRAPVGLKGRKQLRNGTATAGGRGRKKAQQPLPAGVTALSYLPDGEGHKLLSAGSANGIIKCWDLRHVRNSRSSDPVSQIDPQSIIATWETPDLSLLTPSSTTGLGSFKRAHGVSQILSSCTSLYASCTGGKIYSLPLSTFLDSHLTPSEVQTLYDPVQCQNTLFSRMALFDDRFLAVGCNTGNIALWDVTSRREHARRQQSGDEAERDTQEERRVAAGLEMGFASRSRENGMAVLMEGHVKNTEVNAVAWANGPNGPTLSSVGDDTKVRSWYADRAVREELGRAAEE
ncbi:hypothetical protein NDA13_002827 [Ustilago tritici]|nr:hypothetical protein NDA13_002827 [Ustilago tritici]